MSNYFFRKKDASAADTLGKTGLAGPDQFTEPETTSQADSQTIRQTTEESVIHAGNEGSAVVLRLAITRTARRLRQEVGSDLSPTALAALASIERHAPLTPTGLAEIEGVKRPTATRVINHLIERELIERLPDPNDGRSCHLTLTTAGSDYLAEARSRKSAYLARLLNSLPADDVATLERAAIILEDALEDSDRGQNR
ncbi:MAG: MarR family transcriptional regulator [Thermoleophilia bacterium]|nr:MarR family transcriptional regulator [Thermoleophilia bacterium]